MCKANLTPLLMERQGNHFYIEADILFTYEQVKNCNSYPFTPMLSDGKHSLELPLMLVVGKKRYWSLRLASVGMGKNIFRHYQIMKIIKAVNHTSRNYLYQVKLDYEKWMDEAMISFV